MTAANKLSLICSQISVRLYSTFSSRLQRHCEHGHAAHGGHSTQLAVAAACGWGACPVCHDRWPSLAERLAFRHREADGQEVRGHNGTAGVAALDLHAREPPPGCLPGPAAAGRVQRGSLQRGSLARGHAQAVCAGRARGDGCGARSFRTAAVSDAEQQGAAPGFIAPVIARVL